jgi:hypothetical protein
MSLKWILDTVKREKPANYRVDLIPWMGWTYRYIKFVPSLLCRQQYETSVWYQILFDFLLGGDTMP